MKVLALVLLLAGVVAQEPEVYPPGHVCVRAEQVRGPADHPCSCHRRCENATDGDGTVTGTYVQEDPQCQQYCHKEHCACPVENCE
jgi:hypothetical protein